MIRFVGSCPVCERLQKLTDGKRMVHHGYKRPGYGNIVGDCFGVGYAPYELSNKGCVDYRAYLSGWITDVERTLRQYESRPSEVSVSAMRRGRIETRVFKRDSEDPKDRRDYESSLAAKIRETEYTLSELRRSEKRMESRILSWRLAPLTEIDEEGLTQADRDARVARKSERETKKEEQARKRTELQAKRNERLVRKATALLFFFDEFERLNRQNPSPQRAAYARDLLFEAQKKKYGLSYPWDLMNGPDDGYGNHMKGPWGLPQMDHALMTLLELEVADPNSGGGPRPAYPHTVAFSSGNKIRVPDPDPTKSTEELLDEIANRRLT